SLTVNFCHMISIPFMTSCQFCLNFLHEFMNLDNVLLLLFALAYPYGSFITNGDELQEDAGLWLCLKYGPGMRPSRRVFNLYGHVMEKFLQDKTNSSGNGFFVEQYERFLFSYKDVNNHIIVGDINIQILENKLDNSKLMTSGERFLLVLRGCPRKENPGFLLKHLPRVNFRIILILDDAHRPSV
ncbi:hypothetical protein L9F63_011960, partial [Diploptera punctata]